MEGTGSGVQMKWKIPLNKPCIDIQEHVAVGDVLKSGMLSQGKVVEEFEEKVRRYCEARYAVAVSSCTAGLYLALRNKVDLWNCKVAIPAFTFPAAQCCVKHFGGEMGIEHIDVNEDTYNIDTDDLANKSHEYRNSIDPIEAVIPIHQFGLPCEIDKVNKIASECNAHVIEDAACALGSTYKGEPIGKHGTAVFSFHGRKILTSVSGDEYILVKNDNTGIEIMRIQEFVDRYFSEHEEGDKEIELEWKAPTFNRKTGKTNWSNITSVVRHVSPNELIKVTTEKNRSVTITNNHSIFTRCHGKTIEKNANDLQIGDNIIVPLSLPHNDMMELSIDITKILMDSLSDDELDEMRLTLCPKYQKSVDCTRKGHYGSIPLSDIKKSNDYGLFIIAKRKGKTGGSAGIKVDANMPITTDLCRLLGYYIAEGSHTEKTINFSFGGNENDIIDDCEKCIKNVFPFASVKRYSRYEGRAISLVFNGKIICKLLDLLVGRGAENKHLPKFAFNTTQKLKRELLDAYIKGDGTERTINGSDAIEMKTVSKRLATEIRYLLMTMDIQSSVYIEKEGTTQFKDYISQKRESYNIHISGIKGFDIRTLEMTYKNKEENMRFNDTTMLKITKIEKVTPSTKYVYDISCPPHENFIGGMGGIYLHNTGEGGMVVTDDEELYDKIMEGRQFGRNSHGEFHGEGMNFKMSDLAAAVGCVQMEKLPEILRERAEVASIYRDLLGKNTSITLPEYIEGTNWQSYVIRLQTERARSWALSEMRRRGIEVQVGSYDNSHGTCRISEELSKTTLALPIWPGMTREMIETVASELNDSTTIQQI